MDLMSGIPGSLLSRFTGLRKTPRETPVSGSQRNLSRGSLRSTLQPGRNPRTACPERSSCSGEFQPISTEPEEGEEDLRKTLPLSDPACPGGKLEATEAAENEPAPGAFQV
jgi:hypothetical protein